MLKVQCGASKTAYQPFYEAKSDKKYLKSAAMLLTIKAPYGTLKRDAIA